MDQYTTNINDLPIDSNPPENRELPEKELNLTMNRVIETPLPEKKVTFEIPHVEKKTLYEIKESHKIILFASLFFLLFSDLKVKSYIINILIVIFGTSLKTTGGSVSKVGLVLYTIVYCVCLTLFITCIDLATTHFS